MPITVRTRRKIYFTTRAYQQEFMVYVLKSLYYIISKMDPKLRPPEGSIGQQSLEFNCKFFNFQIIKYYYYRLEFKY